MKKLMFLFLLLLKPFVGIGQEARLVLPIKHTGLIGNIIHNPDSSLILTSSADNTARVWTKDGKLLYVLEGHETAIDVAAFSPATKSDRKGGEKIVTVSTKSMRFWETKSGKLLNTIYFDDYLFLKHLAISPDGTKILLHDTREVSIYNFKTGKKIEVIHGDFTEGIALAVFSDDGKMHLELFKDKVFELHGYKGKQTFSAIEDFLKSDLIKNNFKDLYYQSNQAGLDKYLESLSADDFRYEAEHHYHGMFRDVNINESLLTQNDSTSIIYSDISPDANLVASALINNEILLWELNSAKPLKYLYKYPAKIQKIRFSKNGKLLLTTLEDYTLSILDVSTGKLVKEFSVASDNPKIAGEDGFRDAFFSPDDKSVLSVTKGSTVSLFDMESGSLKYSSKEDNLFYASFSKDGKNLLLNLWGEDKYRVLDANTGVEIKVSKADIEWVLPPNQTKDRILSINGNFSNKLYTYNTNTKTYQNFEKHSDNVYVALFSPPSYKDPNGGKYILSNGYDDRSIIWDAVSGRPLYTRLQLKNGEWLVYDEDYRFDGSQGAIDLLYFTCGLEIVELEKARNALYVPNLVQKIMNGENLEHLPKLKDLKICKK